MTTSSTLRVTANNRYRTVTIEGGYSPWKDYGNKNEGQ